MVKYSGIVGSPFLLIIDILISCVWSWLTVEVSEIYKTTTHEIENVQTCDTGEEMRVLVGQCWDYYTYYYFLKK